MLSIRNLKTYFRTPKGLARAVDGVSLDIGPGEVVGVVGESGCGKSVMALSILGLLPRPPAYYAGGEILFNDLDLLKFKPDEMRRLRGNQISMIFQEPMSALNPVFTVGNQLQEVFQVHRNFGRAEALQSAIDMLATVGVPAPRRRVREYPYQLSGGIAPAGHDRHGARLPAGAPFGRRAHHRARCDVQAQYRAHDGVEESSTAILLITHDLGVVAEITRRVAVVCTGRIMEEAPTRRSLRRPAAPLPAGF